MRKSLIIIITSLSLVALVGCTEKLNSTRDSILDTANKTAEGLGYQYETTKSSIQQKADDVEAAAEKVKKLQESVAEAKEALEKITQ